jgi:hypothetical protein
MKKKHNMITALSLIEQGFAKAETVERLLGDNDAVPFNRYIEECNRARNPAVRAESDADLAQHTAEFSAWCRKNNFAAGLVAMLWEQSGQNPVKLKEALRQHAGFIQDYNMKNEVNEAYKRITKP